MRRAYVNNWIVLNTAGWAAREQPLESNEGGFNSENGDVRIGPGMWADLAPDEAPGIGAVTPVGFPYRFSVINTAPGISAGYVRVNGTSDALFIRKTDMVVQDRSTTLATLSAGGLVYLNSVVDDGAVAVFKATSCEDSGTYYTVNGILSGSLPNDNDEIRVTIAPVDVNGLRRITGYISQVNTSAPTAVIVSNSYGTTPVFSFLATGQFMMTLPGAFGAGKWVGMILPSWQASNMHVPQLAELDADSIVIATRQGGSFANALMSSNPFYFETYP